MLYVEKERIKKVQRGLLSLLMARQYEVITKCNLMPSTDFKKRNGL
jgi:hypothetical protein